MDIRVCKISVLETVVKFAASGAIGKSVSFEIDTGRVTAVIL